MKLHLINVKRIIIMIVILICMGCMKQVQPTTQIDDIVTSLTDTTITCPGSPADTCAIASEFHDLAEQAQKESSDETPRHFVSFLNYGKDALLARIHLIRSAKKSIEVQTYIWANDEVGQLVFMELLRAARRGVNVRIIVDQITVTAAPALIAQLASAHANLEISLYNPIFSEGKSSTLTVVKGALFSFRKLNQRMHNKLFIVDDSIAIVGGRNIENKYYDYDPIFAFKDRDVLVMGPAAKQAADSFDQYWNNEVVVKAIYLSDVGAELVKLRENGKPPSLDAPDVSLFADLRSIADSYSICSERPQCRPFRVGRVEYTADHPGKSAAETPEKYENISSTMAQVLDSAQKSVTIQTPYLIMSKTALRKLRKMRKKKPDLTFTVSTNSLAATDLYFIYAQTYRQKKQFVKDLGFNLYELKPFPGDARFLIPRYDQLRAHKGPEELLVSSESDNALPVQREGPRIGLHAKSIVIDNEIAIIGSHNLTPRSIAFNTENAMIIRDEAFARELEQNILRDTLPQNSWVIAKKETIPLLSHVSWMIGNISRMIPFFDVWPFRYTSSFELKKGMDPLTPHDPDFYKHYVDVGQFPDVDLPQKAIKTRLFKAFGGFTAPIM
jgi:phosphatidylserine/phosphatidylglycerophosphate/cardiolipin synthase-like enzyme